MIACLTPNAPNALTPNAQMPRVVIFEGVIGNPDV